MTLRQRAEQAAEQLLRDIEVMTGEDVEQRRIAIVSTWIESEARAFAERALRHCYRIRAWEAASDGSVVHAVEPRASGQMDHTKAGAEAALTTFVAEAIAAAEKG